MTAQDKDLFGEPVPENFHRASGIGPKGGKHYCKPRGHAAPSGSGPQEETCRNCEHRIIFVSGSGRKTWSKCNLARAIWTGGRATDIRASDPACRLWEAEKPTDKQGEK